MSLSTPPSRPSTGKRLLLAFISIFLGLAAAALLLEGILRFLPVKESFDDDTPITSEQPVKHFRKNATLTWSKGFDFSLANTVRTNNYGFVNNQDYDPVADSPLLAVIGDSYVEAAMVPYARTLQGRLAASLEDRGRVYSFAAAGSPLSQYLAYAAYARKTFHPQAMLFVIVGNDFDESLLEYKKDPGFHYFVRKEDGSLELGLVEYHPRHATWLHELGAALGLGNSALVRYVRSNWPLLREQMRQWGQEEDDRKMERFVGQTLAAAAPERVEKSKEAVDAFFRLLPEISGLPAQRCFFVVDGIRPHLYDTEKLATAQGSYFQIMRDYFIGQARRLGYECIDLQPLFVQRHEATGEHYEFPDDGHWNSLGHAMAAQAAEDSRTFKALFGEGDK